jgi:SnoaL-like domain
VRCQRLIGWRVLVACTVVVLLAAETLALAGCGGQGTSTSTKSASPPSAAAAPAPTPSPTLRAAPWRPGSDSLAQTAAVARQWLRLLYSEAFASSHIWAKDVTFDNWSPNMHSTGEAVKQMYCGAPGSTDEWGPGHILVRPGVAALEEQFSPAPGAVLTSLDLLAVSGGKIVHEEVFYNAAQDEATPVTPWPTAPGPGDTAAATKQTAGAFSRAMAAADLTTMGRLLAPDVLFYDVADTRARQGSGLFATWWNSLRPVTFQDMPHAPLTVGDGWAVARWTATGTGAYMYTMMPGATVYEVRNGEIVRLTLYYEAGALPLHL